MIVFVTSAFKWAILIQWAESANSCVPILVEFYNTLQLRLVFALLSSTTCTSASNG